MAAAYDDKNLCDTLKYQLEREGILVDACTDGLDGLHYMKEDAHDMVLLDRMLPTMNGLQVLRRARKAQIKTPVIMITALGELYDKVEGLDSGADDYIVKPFEFPELLARIHSLSRRSGQWEAGDLDNYVHFLRRRLKTVNSEVSLITVRGVGYVLE